MNRQITNSNDVRKAVVVGYRNHWQFREIPRRGLPDKPVWVDGFWCEILKSHSSIPHEGKNIIKALEKAGVEYQGIVVAHEAPKYLSGPVAKPKPIIDTKKAQVVVSDALPILEAGLELLVKGVEVVVTIAEFTMVAMGYVLTAAIMVDPVMVVVLKDGTWLEVMRWYED